MNNTRTMVTLAVTVFAALFVTAISLEPAMARQGGSGGGHSMGGGGARSFSGSGGGARSFSGGGSRSFSSGRSTGNRSYGGSRQFSRTFRSPSGSSRIYAYRSPDKHHRHHRHFRGRGFAYGYPYVDGYYGYADSCYWLRRRALSTGSSYWWNRYYDCTSGTDYY
jgi:hypothetical protein